MKKQAYGSAIAVLFEMQKAASSERQVDGTCKTDLGQTDGHSNARQAPFDRQAVGMRMKQLRLHLNLSQKDMGQRLSISWRTYQNYERGERVVPFETACQFAIITGVPMEWIALGGPIDFETLNQSLDRS